ncbi:MAG: hypothetical protein QGG54_18955, partial [Gammaproteobacteria bacterium]|nr:hypothetical protein [Gammaproteobacteria bacterium]
MKHFVNALLQFLIVITSLLSIQTQAQQVLRPDELCSENPRAIASFADADLEAAVRSALSIGPVDDLACSLVTGLTALTTSGPGPTQIVSGSPRWPAADAPFESLAGLQNLTSLTRLALNNLDITDISQLSGLTNLTFLSLHTNYVSDISPLIGLTNLTSLLLSENPVSDISALRNLTELRMLRLHSQQIFPRLPQDAPHMGSISDITPLRGLINLRDLSLHTMLITDISALAGLINLTDLRINGNTISDISVLSRLTNLKYLALHNNLISDVSPL